MEKQTNNMDEALEALGQLTFESELTKEKDPEVFRLLTFVKDSYILVQWPESQDYMEEEWFRDEAILAVGSEDRTGDSAYFIPMKRII